MNERESMPYDVVIVGAGHAARRTAEALRARDAAFKGLVADELARTVWPHVEAGRLSAVVDRSYPLEQADDAHRLMESGGHVGKIALTLA